MNNANELVKAVLIYRVTHLVDSNLLLTSKPRFRIGLACPDRARTKWNFCFDANGRFESTRCATLFIVCVHFDPPTLCNKCKMYALVVAKWLRPSNFLFPPSLFCPMPHNEANKVVKAENSQL